VERSKYVHKWYACDYGVPSDIKPALVSFDSTSQGHLAMVIYEWKDYQYLGKVTSKTDEYLPVSIVLPSDRNTLICLASRRHMYAPPMLYEGVFAVHPTSVALFSTCQTGSQLRTPRFGPRESHSLGAKAVPVIRQANV
jgi:hypothetical protein